MFCVRDDAMARWPDAHCPVTADGIAISVTQTPANKIYARDTVLYRRFESWRVAFQLYRLSPFLALVTLDDTDVKRRYKTVSPVTSNSAHFSRSFNLSHPYFIQWKPLARLSKKRNLKPCTC